VEKFMDWKAEDGIWQYRVQWEGYGPLDDLWEPPSKLLHLEDQLQGFYANHPYVLKPDDPLPVVTASLKRWGSWSKSLKSEIAFFGHAQLSTLRLLAINTSLLAQSHCLKLYSLRMLLGAQLTITFVSAS
jgi:hypothetical protein